uniref:Uncharacterized protein n=1 Tax=Nelumbo nucifera TaxID=4432 RepID=A0A822Y5N2_NELNU|nr:TPA_asm: hypothetical protein HUJ06_028801 [Nelumbo nucifera]
MKNEAKSQLNLRIKIKERKKRRKIKPPFPSYVFLAKLIFQVPSTNFKQRRTRIQNKT